MRTASTDESGVVSSDTELLFEQTADVVSARYRGGAIVDGYLIGRLSGARIHFRYIQTDVDGRLDAGVSDGYFERLPDGRLRLTERFQWITRPEQGTNVFEEPAKVKLLAGVARAEHEQPQAPSTHPPEPHMPQETQSEAVVAVQVPPRPQKTIYPEPFASRVAGREKRALGDAFGLKNFGVNLTKLAPGSMSALRHAHTKQDELVYILEGSPTLHTDRGAQRLLPGMCAGFPSGTGNAHHLVNESDQDVIYLEIGDRTPGDLAIWPDDDLQVIEIDGKWCMAHRDGTSY